ncbi:MAG TPA: hypothetical protein VFY10_03000 [Dehalococcoidia bacterium]|nr:hypothetical protein [Dehalococcoidia bacterium]
MLNDHWIADLRRIHDQAFSIDWQAHVDEANRRLALAGDDALRLSLPGLPPLWFNGDVQSIEPGQWTLVLSLNHQLGDEKHAPSAPNLWDWCRTHNRVLWYWRFFRPLVQLASMVLTGDAASVDEREYATTRMVFVELCPYASPAFRLGAEQITELVNIDPGFETAAKVRDILINQAEPALILLNGKPTLESFEAIYGDRLDDWHRLTYASPESEARKLWHSQGFFRQARRRIPIVGFPFLRTRMSHNSNAEIRQLAAKARQFFLTQRLRALVQFLPQFEEANFKFGTLIEPESKMGVIRLPLVSVGRG